MASVIGVVIALGAAALVLALVLVVGRQKLAANQGAWQEAALELGLTWQETPEDPGVGRVSGQLDGYEVSIVRERLRDASHPSRSWPVTRVQTELGFDLGVGFAVASKKARFSWVTKAAQQPRLGLGDPVFELRVVAHARDPGAVALLGAESRQALLAGDDVIPGFYLDDTTIVTEFEGVERDRAKLVATARGQVALADALRRTWGRQGQEADSTRQGLGNHAQ